MSTHKVARSRIRPLREVKSKATIVRDLASGKEHDTGTLDSPSSLVTGFQDRLRRLHGARILAATSITGGLWLPVRPMGEPVALSSRGFHVVPSHDGSSLFFIRDTGAARSMRELWMSSVDGSNPRKVGTIGPLPPDIWGYDVSPTNQIVYTRLNASRRELWLANLK